MTTQVLSQSQSSSPAWLENGKINEIRFLNTIRQYSHFRVVNGVFYDEGEHRVEDDTMKEIIVRELQLGVTDRLNKRCGELLSLMRFMWAYTEDTCSDRYIHLENGTLDTYTDEFTEEKQFTTRRLHAAYDPQCGKPERFLAYLQDLLEPEDIPTLQEYLGYCLIPTTKAQKMLVISGKGGEGKSVLGQIMAEIWGDTLYFGSIQKISTDRFARATLIDRLVMVDDDMSLDALPQTHVLKTLITLNGKTDVEKKGVQSYLAPLHARFLGFSNGTLSALYDRSHGFYRRLILLKTKDRPKDREDQPYLAESILSSERNQIFLWCLEGLETLLSNMFRFTISPQARRTLAETIRAANPLLDFLESTGYILYDSNGSISSADLYELYRDYCLDNGLPEPNKQTSQQRLREQLVQRGITPTSHVPHQRTRSIRGYLGIRAAQPVQWYGSHRKIG